MISAREGPTASPQTNLLIELCLETIETGEAPAQLRNVLATRQAGMEVARQDFMGKVQEHDRQQTELLQGEIDEVLGEFDRYGETLGCLQRYLETHDVADVQQAIAGLTQGTPRLTAALDAYEARFMVIGPSEYPIVNIWTKVVDAVRSQSMDAADLQAMLEGARDFFAHCLHELDTYPEPETTGSAAAALRDGYQLFLSALDAIETCSKDGQTSHLDEALERIDRSRARLQQGLDAYREIRMTGQAVAMVIQATNMVLKGEMFGSGLDSLENFFGPLKALPHVSIDPPGLPRPPSPL